MSCAHRRRLWVVSPGPRVACPFGFCDECGAKLGALALEAVVKEAYPAAPRERSWSDPEEGQPTGWELACASGWVMFLYPGPLVTALFAEVPSGRRAPFYRSFLPPEWEGAGHERQAGRVGSDVGDAGRERD